MLMQKLYATARCFPQHEAIIYGEQRMSYAQMVRSIEQYSQAIKQMNITSGDRVALLLPNIPEFIVSFFAVTALGASVVALNPQFQQEELEIYLRQCQVKMIITDEQTITTCRNIIASWAETIPAIVVGQQQKGTSLPGLIEDQFPAELSDCGSDKEAVFLYSSGTTGPANGVTRTHQQCWWGAESYITTAKLTQKDRIFCAVPLFHAYGIFTCLLAAAYSGAALILFKDPSPFVLHSERALSTLEHEQVSVLPGVPYLLQTLVDAPAQADLSALRLCISSAVPMSNELFEAFYQKFGTPLRQLYGCTEAGCITLNIDEHPEQTAASVGTLMEYVDITIRDEQGTVLPARQIGEIVVRSPAAAGRYFDLDELSSRVFRDGYYFTGDLGWMDQQGHLYITERKTLVIEIAGHKVSPVQIEETLIKHPKVREVVVVGTKGQVEGGELIKAVVVTYEPCQAEDLISFCRQRLAAFKVPGIVEFRDEIPKGPTGKILRKYLV